MPPQPPIDEKELLIKLRGGDEKAFNHIYHHYKRRITTNLFKLLKNQDLVRNNIFITVYPFMVII